MDFQAVVRDLLEEQAHKGNSQRTVAFYEEGLRRFVAGTGIVELAEFNASRVRAWLASYSGLSRSSVRTYDRALRVFDGQTRVYDSVATAGPGRIWPAWEALGGLGRDGPCWLACGKEFTMRASVTFPAELIAMEESPLEGGRFGPSRVVERDIEDVPGLVGAVARAADVSEAEALNLARELLEGGPVVVMVERGHRKLQVEPGRPQPGAKRGVGSSDA